MFLYVEKLLPVFVYPLGLSLVLCLVTLAPSMARRSLASRLTVSAAIVLLWISSTPAFADLITASLEDQYPGLPIARAPIVDVIIVLGGDIASPRARLSEPELGEGADRLFQAYALWRAGKAKLILISGGDLPWAAASRPEAEIVGEALQTLGVPAMLSWSKDKVATRGRRRSTAPPSGMRRVSGPECWLPRRYIRHGRWQPFERSASIWIPGQHIFAPTIHKGTACSISCLMPMHSN